MSGEEAYLARRRRWLAAVVLVVSRCGGSCWSAGAQSREKLVWRRKPFSSPCCRRGGKKEEEQCCSKRHRSSLFFIYIMYETTLFWRKRTISFKCGARTRQFPTYPSIIFVHFNCVLVNFGPRPHSWPRFSLWSLASDLCNLALNWSINFQFLQLGPCINSKQPLLFTRFFQIGPWFPFFTIKPLIGH